METPENKEKIDFEILDATPDDMEGMAEVIEQTWLDTYPNEELGITEEDIRDKNFKDPERIKKQKERMADQHNVNVLVAKVGERIVGICRLSTKESRQEINALYILPEYQGKGIGSELMNQALGKLDKNENIWVNVRL